ncbi:hypothetical protein ACO2Q8_18425 [Larkinella sp. VNQ87]|uniref:hypothetical protein n=1 Tax=Larkinella sp. VNQ87 TaxID=3400921 RepID=UPI003C11E066
MQESIRRAYNETFSPERYRAFVDQIHRDYPGQLDFRVAETPVFVPKTLKNRLLAACDSIIETITREDFKDLSEAAIPPGQRVPNENDHSSFLAIDFAICRDETRDLTPQLIELQGFPSLYGFQSYLAGNFRNYFPIPDGFSHLFDVDSDETYRQHLRRLIVGLEQPENVILLEIYPEKQKTRIDFRITEEMLGIEAVCLTRIQKEGRQLFYEKDGQRHHIKRIYNRLIFDELATLPDLKTDFSLTDDVDVEWVGHPNWFFRISKHTLPLLNSPYVPESRYLNTLGTYPADLENYVLKPLFSFAGSGVKLNITKADLDAIEDRQNYLLQRKVSYEPVIQSPDGLVKCEIRMLYIWHDKDPHPTLLTNLARLSRGEMIGVRFNKDFDWVGGTVCFFEE